jgi:hypothetical protein
MWLYGCGWFKGEGDEKPNLLYGEKWNYKEWLKSDDFVPIKSQQIPLDYPIKNIFDPDIFNKQKETFNLKPLTIYETTLNIDHITNVGVIEMYHDRLNFYKFLGRIVESINKYNI